MTADTRIRSSLAPHVAPSRNDDGQVRDLAVMVFRQGRGVMFFAEDLKRMPWQARELIEAEARRLYGAKRR
jgi:hypothetical protein